MACRRQRQVERIAAARDVLYVLQQVVAVQQVVQVGVALSLTVTAPGAVEIFADDEALLGRDELVEDVGELIAEQSCNGTGWTVDANDGNVVRRS